MPNLDSKKSPFVNRMCVSSRRRQAPMHTARAVLHESDRHSVRQRKMRKILGTYDGLVGRVELKTIFMGIRSIKNVGKESAA